MAKSIMIQGTMSNSGKSVLAAALCRIFRNDGYRVAPFKSQNMALNSFVTREGLEMGRAQVMQAEAAGVEPSVRMNPILLKPTSDVGSQVIVNGKAIGTMPAREYFRRKKELIPLILDAYQALDREYDIIVIEGAGSPAEINLKADDIVNMGLARMVDAPVLLVGDIDRGGVFASLYGTISLLEEEERRRIRGLLINKFRGDQAILAPGLDTLTQLTGKPVLGVVPWMDLDLDEEDSLSGRFSARRSGRPIDAAVIRLPRISNFTDFAPLERHPAFGIRYVSSPAELGTPDLILLPGTKNTISDLIWMRESGLEAAIFKAADRSAAVIGVCGGYQMLGTALSDPDGVEQGGQVRGMGLLPMETVFSADKTLAQKQYCVQGLEGFFAPLNGIGTSGYEIHMGRSTAAEPFIAQGRVLGTYLHGVFDSPAFTEGLARLLAQDKGLGFDWTAEGIDPVAYKDQQYELLADTVRHSLDMAQIYSILEQGGGIK